MPKDKDLKKLIRARMQKTGESYTAARAKLLAKTAKPGAPLDHAALAGMTDAAVAAKTGREWREWTRRLDAVGASKWPHKEIAKHVRDEHGLTAWWAQSVAVGYERIKGLREKTQRRAGSYDANKSRTFPVPVSKLYGAFTVTRTRRRWLPDVEWTVRTQTKDKSMRITWRDGTSVSVYFTAKDDAKSAVAIQHGKLPTKAAVTEMKAYWTERLDALAQTLA